MNLIDKIDVHCAKARGERKHKFTVECSDWEAVSDYMNAEAMRLQALKDQEAALSRIKGE